MSWLYKTDNPLGLVRHLLFDDLDYKYAPDSGPDYVKGLFECGDGVYQGTPKGWINDIEGDFDARRGRDWEQVHRRCIVLAVAHYTRTEETGVIHDMVVAEMEYRREGASRYKRRFVCMQLPGKRTPYDWRAPRPTEYQRSPCCATIQREKRHATEGFTLVASFSPPGETLTAVDLVATAAVAGDMAKAYSPLSHMFVWHAVLVYGILRGLCQKRAGRKIVREKLRGAPGVVRGVAIVDRRGVLLHNGVLDDKFSALDESRAELEQNLALNAGEVGNGDLITRGVRAVEAKCDDELWPAIRTPPVVPPARQTAEQWHEWQMANLEAQITAIKSATVAKTAMGVASLANSAAFAAAEGALEGRLAARKAKSDALAAGDDALAAEWAAREDEYAARAGATELEVVELGAECDRLKAEMERWIVVAEGLVAESAAKRRERDFDNLLGGL